MNMKSPWTCACLLVLFGCQPDTTSPYGDGGLNAQQGKVLRYLALGDSYTVGEAVTPSARWPNQLVDALRPALQAGDSLAPAHIVATTGWTTADLKQGMDGEALDTTADLVSLLIGVNNQYQACPSRNTPRSSTRCWTRPRIWRGRHDARVCGEHSDYGSPFGQANQASISASLQAFNDTCRTRTLAKGVAHFNITDISQQWPDTPGLVAVDGLHPSGVQYGLWVDSFADEVADLLD